MHARNRLPTWAWPDKTGDSSQKKTAITDQSVSQWVVSGSVIQLQSQDFFVDFHPSKLTSVTCQCNSFPICWQCWDKSNKLLSPRPVTNTRIAGLSFVCSRPPTCWARDKTGRPATVAIKSDQSLDVHSYRGRVVGCFKHRLWRSLKKMFFKKIKKLLSHAWNL